MMQEPFRKRALTGVCVQESFDFLERVDVPAVETKALFPASPSCETFLPEPFNAIRREHEAHTAKRKSKGKA